MKSIIQDDLTRCYVCGRIGNLEIHHVMSGVANRPLSTKYKLIVALCPEHHRGKTGVHTDYMLNERIKRDAQFEFERTHTHAEWMRIFKKSYL